MLDQMVLRSVIESARKIQRNSRKVLIGCPRSLEWLCGEDARWITLAKHWRQTPTKGSAVRVSLKKPLNAG